jgi:pimeloyl-ACP methyl ester carboxylesterase
MAPASPIPGSIAELTTVRLGGREQTILVRGRSADLPVLLYLSGGPGQSDLPYVRVLFEDLAQHFLVVGWDQRGTGKSYAALDPTGELTLAQAVADTIELTTYLRDRFGEEKIYLLGESWGTTLGVLAVQQRPDLYHAWIGSGQMVSQRATDRQLYHDVLALAGRTGDRALRDQMLAFGEPPYADIPYPNAIVMGAYPRLETPYTPPRAYIERGTAANLGPYGIFASEYSFVEKANVLRGLIDMFTVMYPQLQEIDFRRDVRRLDVPVYILDGAAELPARRDLALAWYEQLDAPIKRLYTFENSGHSVAFEQFEALEQILTETVLVETQLTQSSAAALPTPAAFAAFFDAALPEQLAAEEIAGAMAAVVHKGELVFAQGYGAADVDAGVPVTADRTLFFVGSVGKLWTWSAVMQLAEQGKLDLHADVNGYLDFAIPAAFGQPITLHHLMTHSAGFEEEFNSLFVAGEDRVLPLRDHLVRQYARARLCARRGDGLLELWHGAGGLHRRTRRGSALRDVFDRAPFAAVGDDAQLCRQCCPTRPRRGHNARLPAAERRVRRRGFRVCRSRAHRAPPHHGNGHQPLSGRAPGQRLRGRRVHPAPGERGRDARHPLHPSFADRRHGLRLHGDDDQWPARAVAPGRQPPLRNDAGAGSGPGIGGCRCLQHAAGRRRPRHAFPPHGRVLPRHAHRAARSAPARRGRSRGAVQRRICPGAQQPHHRAEAGQISGNRPRLRWKQGVSPSTAGALSKPNPGSCSRLTATGA